MSSLTLDGLMKAYNGKPVLERLDLGIADGEFVSLLGPSGCGKTTTLNIIAGFLAPDAGTVRIGSEDVTRRPANRRNTAMVFQNYALFPHMRVLDNVGYGLRVRRLPDAVRVERARAALETVGLVHLADRYPGQLSGGQQQRVAVARAIAVQPGVLLMDEPLSNLDAKLRGEVRTQLRTLQMTLQQTVVFVTHDQEEALTMSDRIVVMSAGRIEQVGTPAEVYETPTTVFVADFMGVRNIFHGRSTGDGWVSDSGVEVRRTITEDYIGVRPGDVRLGAAAHPPGACASSVRAHVRSAAYLGDAVEYVCAAGADTVTALVPRAAATFSAGSEVILSWDAAAVLPLAGSPAA